MAIETVIPTLRERLQEWLAQAPAELRDLRVTADAPSADLLEALRAADHLTVIGATAVVSRAETFEGTTVQLMFTRPATRADLRQLAEQQLAEAERRAGL